MRLSCEVHVVYSLLASQTTDKPVRSTLALGVKPDPEARSVPSTARTSREVVLLLCTGKDAQAKKYKVTNNVLRLFTKFVRHGKATIVFRNPSHQLCISKADPGQLQNFLRLLNPTEDKPALASLPELPDPTALRCSDQRPKLKMTITKRQNYPLKDGFPSTLETLAIQNCLLARVDSRIMQLEHLHTLDLRDNRLKDLPSSMSNLGHLAELRVAANQLSSFPQSLCQTSLSRSLKTLDLSGNHLAFLPAQFGHLTSLVTLNLANNRLESLPFTFHHLQALRRLLLLNNRLRYLPSNMHHLHLDILDISGNDFAHEESVRVIQSRLGVMSLLELSARVMKYHHMPYNNGFLPHILCSYLDVCRTCMCSMPCFTCFEHCIGVVDSRRMAITAVTDSKGYVPMEAFFCSLECKKRYVSQGHLLL